MAKITTRSLARALHDAGLIPGDLNDISRIVIDLDPNKVPIMYVQYVMDEKWLDVVHNLDGIRVVTNKTGESGDDSTGD